MKEHYLTIISHKHSDTKHLYVVQAENSVKASLAAWRKFQETYGTEEQNWLLFSVVIPLNEDEPKNIARL